MMKRKVRRLLSLALIVILLFSMMPAAFAASSTDYYSWDTSTVTGNGLALLICYSNGGHTPASYGYTTRCSVCGATGTYYGYGTGTGDITGHTHVYSSTGSTQHQLICYTLGASCPYNGLTSTHTYSSTGYCSDCGYYYYGTGSSLGHNHQYTQISGTYAPYYHYTTCTDSTCTYYQGNYEAHTGTPCYYCGYTGYGYGTTGNLSWSNNSPYCTGGYTAHIAVPYQTTGGYTAYYCSSCYATATGYGTGTGYGSDYAYGTNGLTVYAYDSMTNDTYTLNETVTLSVSPYMTVNGSAVSTGYDFYYSWGGDAYSYDNSGTAYLDTSKSSCTAYCTVYAYPTGTTITSSTTPTDTATVYWSANAIATDAIIYTGLTGNNVKLDEDDFEDFWAEQYPYGTLNYVRFTSVSSGNLYDNYGGGSTLRTDVRSRGSSCYLSPTTGQIGLDDLTYVPSTYSSNSTVTIQFTAYGTSNYNYGSSWGSSYGNTSLSGTITILYTAKEVTPIVYGITGTSVALDADDFIAKYKEVMNVTYTGNLSIQFLEAPTYGTLTLNYGNSYWYQTSGTKLTDTNIGSYSFSTSATGTYSLDNLTYTPGTTSGDSIRFACYSGNQLKFVGTVTFGASDQYTVELTTTAGKAVTFAAAFNDADSTGLLTSGYLYLGTPSVGTLYKNYANGTGTRVTTSDYFTTSNLAEITYVPRTGYVGVAEIPYTAYTYLGAQINGTIKVYVGRSFKDVTGASVWAAPYINKLSAQGIVNGTDASMTKFSPTKTITYGEALKLIMMAAGYPEQAKTGTHWASGYLTKAYYDGLVSTSNIDLDAEVNRDTIATTTAKALGLSSASSVNYGITAPSDSANGYVYALYNAGIIDGVNQNGKNYFLGANNITRAEISKIICMVADYAE